MFLIDNTTSFLERPLGRVFFELSTIWLKVKLLLSTTTQILLRVWLSLQAAVSGGWIYSDLDHFSAHFHLLHWEECIGVLGHHIQILACSKLLYKPYSVVSLQDLHYSCRFCCRIFSHISWRDGFQVLGIYPPL